ncbi:MAG: Gldg family protein, partial [Promethearchaeota archaeon]
MRGNKTSISNLGGFVAILGLVALVVGLVLLFVFSEIAVGASVVISIGVLLIITALVLDFRRVKKAVSSRRGRFGFSSTVLACIFIGIVIFVNSISITVYKRFDTSSLEQFTLTPQTINTLRDLNTPVSIIGFFVAERDYLHINGYLNSLISSYKNYGKYLTFQVVDPDQHPDQAKKYNITEYSTLVFISENNQRLVPPSQYIHTDSSGDITGIEAEHALTSAIIEVTGVAQKRVYFLTGHGEEDINNRYSSVKKSLLDNLYKVYTHNLITAPQIPEDCATLIICAPHNAFTEDEISIIEKYLFTGGSAFILTNPGGISDIDELILPWGIKIGEGIIINPSSSLSPHQDIPIVPDNRNYFYLPSVYFPGAAAIICQSNST